ncbi:MAG: hypothetical protein PHQ21_03430 [Firmicutes bacterium]|nr:hypothetical protein [Bacillota bacterium]MDD4336966.1 hypothetical protein [Bacillota bacterium]
MDDFILEQTIIALSPEPVPAEEVLGALGMSAEIGNTGDRGCVPSADPRLPNASALSATLSAISEANRAIVGGLAIPRGVVRVVAIESIADNGILLDSSGKAGGIFVPCSGKLYEGASHVMLAIATIGPLLERRVKAEFDAGDPLAGVVLDAMGTISLRSLTSHIRQTFAQRAALRGMEVGPRIAPGCEAMPLEAQRSLFSLLGADAIGVTLSDSLLMTPLKSTSLVCPLGSDLPDHLTRYSMCDTCPHKYRCTSIVL